MKTITLKCDKCGKEENFNIIDFPKNPGWFQTGPNRNSLIEINQYDLLDPDPGATDDICKECSILFENKEIFYNE